MSTLRERLSKFRIHRIKVQIEYEGEPISQPVKDQVARAMGDVIALALRDRSPTADAMFTLGLHQDIDVEEDET